MLTPGSLFTNRQYGNRCHNKGERSAAYELALVRLVSSMACLVNRNSPFKNG